MRRALIPSAVLIAAVAASGAAMAQTRTQTGESARRETARTATADGLRYLSWPGKASSPVSAAASRPTPAAPAPSALPLTRIAAPAAAAPRAGLTPASHWLPAPAASPPPVATPVEEPATPHAPSTPAPAVASAPADPVADPLAPRRDAPIFRLQAQAQVEAQPQVQASESAPVQTAQIQPAQTAPVLGARLYSVHRQAGLKPDPIPATQPVYLDRLPIEMIQPPASADLAQPDGPPALLRNSDGTVRAAPQTQEDALP